jgi:hypothetical protein
MNLRHETVLPVGDIEIELQVFAASLLLGCTDDDGVDSPASTSEV